MTGDIPFFELGCQSNFSFLEGASHPQEFAVTAQILGLSGFGLADRNTVAGVVRAHKAAKELNFRFQPGARLVFSDDMPDILAYPQNRRGWGNLCRLLTAGNRRAEKGDCILREADLLEWADDMLLVVVPSLSEPGGASLEPVLSRLRGRFKGKVHLVLNPRFDGMDRFHHQSLAGIAQAARIPLIATNLPLYHVPERRPIADVVHAIRTHQTVAQVGLALAANAERHMKSGAEMARLTRTYPEAVANTVIFMSRLTFTLDELRYEYPDETVPGETAAESLQRLAWEGAAYRYPDGIPEDIIKQIDHELKLIGELEYEPYFLTVWDIVRFARDEGILCQGRGSAANSTVCYCLGVTEVNPKFTSLLFERFMSNERREPPDIDVDFEHERREEVIQYIYRKYGRDHAGLAATVISYRTRSAGREVAKAFGFSEDVRSALSSTVWGWSSDDLSEREAKAAGLDLGNMTAKQLLHYGSEINGFPRHLSQHVGGFVITRSRLDEVVPLMNAAMKDRTMVEWDKDDLDTLGILKIDVLALGMLTALKRGLDMLQQHYGISHTIDSLMKDQQPAVYDMICRADTIGVFQIESRAQMSMLPRLRPRKYYDLVIEVAIVRPGPIQGDMVHPYLKRRHKKEDVVYPSEELRSVLEKTEGVPLFQEQAMKIAMVAAGFSGAEADRLRRAMATFRQNGTIHEFEEKMISGMMKRGYQRDFAQRCFNQIKGFGDYGFPESHAASFALLVYASSWVKTYYPDIFCAALLNSQPMGFYAPAQLVRDAREHGVEARPIDVNDSLWDSTLEEADFDPGRIAWRHREMHGVIRTSRAVRLGFRQVKGLHEDDMKRLIAQRGAGYDSVRDLWLRTGLPRFVIERLAEADAFSSIGLSRRDALWAAQALDVESAVEVLPLFSDLDGKALQQEEEVRLPTMLPGESVIEDYRAVRLSLKAHPVSFLRRDFDREGILRSMDLENVPNGRAVTIAGLVLVRQRPGSARGVVFMTLEDETGVANAIVWPKVFEKFRPIVMGARLVKIRGRVQKAEGVIHVVADSLVNGSDELQKLTRDILPDLPLANGDEVRRPVLSKPNRETAEPPTRNAQEAPVHVMPKGRNFH